MSPTGGSVSPNSQWRWPGWPGVAAWRILSLVDGLALQVVAHGTTIGRGDVERWAASAAELELGLSPGTLAQAG